MEFVKWASSVLDEVDSKAAQSVQKIRPESISNHQTLNTQPSTQISSVPAYSAPSPRSSDVSYSLPVSSSVSSVPAVSSSEPSTTPDSLAISVNSSAPSSHDPSPAPVPVSASVSSSSSASDEISSLRAVWHETRQQLAKAKQLLITKEEQFQSRIQALELAQLDELDRVKKDYDGKLSELRALIAANQAEFENALQTKSHFQRDHQREMQAMEEKIKSMEAQKEEYQSQLAALSAERDALVERSEESLRSHRAAMERLRMEENQRFSVMETELRSRIDSLSQMKWNEASSGFESMDAVAGVQRALEESKRENEKLKSEKRWMEAEMGNASEQVQAIKARLEIERKEWRHQVNSLKAQIDAVQLRLDERARELARESDLTQRLRHEKTELEYLLAQERNRVKLDRTDELESRVKELASKLMEKGKEIELLHAERAALRLKLEQAEIKLQVNENYLKNLRDRAIARGQIELEEDLEEGISSVQAMSSSNGLRARSAKYSASDSIGSSFQSPAVKKAFRFFDGISVQVALLLRRYPQARLGFGLYVILLHLWVIFVFSHFLGHTATPNSPANMTNNQFKAP